jgi:hypothetical protein
MIYWREQRQPWSCSSAVTAASACAATARMGFCAHALCGADGRVVKEGKRRRGVSCARNASQRNALRAE